MSFLKECRSPAIKTLQDNELDQELGILAKLQPRARIEHKKKLVLLYEKEALKSLSHKEKDNRVLAYWLVWLFDTGEKKRFFELLEKALGFGLHAPQSFSRDFWKIRRDFALQYQSELRKNDDFSFSEQFLEIVSQTKPHKEDVHLFLREIFHIALCHGDTEILHAIYNIEKSGDLPERIGIRTAFEKAHVPKTDALKKELEIREAYGI